MDSHLNTFGVPVVEYFAVAEQVAAEHPTVTDFQAVDVGNVKSDADSEMLKLLVKSLNGNGFPAIILGAYAVEDFENGGSKVFAVLKPYRELTQDPASLQIALKQRITKRFKAILDGSAKRELYAKYPHLEEAPASVIEESAEEKPQTGLLLADWLEAVTQHPNLTNEAKPFNWLVEFTHGAEASGVPLERVRTVALAEVSKRGLQAQFSALEAAALADGLQLAD
ncbi:hypothetical protein WDZ92_04770 [Nostoc sp. NIES-2111]